MTTATLPLFAEPPLFGRPDPAAEALRRRVEEYSTSRFRYAVFDIALGGEPYQIVARLVYADPLQERLDSVIGFTVNLAWVRRSYFSDILAQVAPIATRGNTFDIAVLDDTGQQSQGRGRLALEGRALGRRFHWLAAGGKRRRGRRAALPLLHELRKVEP